MKAAAIGGAALMIVGAVAPTNDHTRSNARFVISCETDAVQPPGCNSSRYDKAITKMMNATKSHPKVTSRCKPTKTPRKGWIAGYCDGTEDDSTPTRLLWSQLGVVSRANLLR